MASPNSENDSTSMFLQRSEKAAKSPTRSEPSSRRNSTAKTVSAEHITIKDFFDFMKTAYQVYEQLEGETEEGPCINWEEITKLTIINHVIEQQERDLLHQSAYSQQKDIVSKSDMAIERKNSEKEKNFVKHFNSCSEIEGQIKNRRSSLPPQTKVEMLGVWTETNLNCKLNDVFNEGILDSILPYLVGYKKAVKTTSLYAPIIKKPPSSGNDIKKPASFGAFVSERESRDRLGRRKSSIVAAQERVNQRQEGEVEIHVCDEVKGLKKDFRCPQKLLVSKMGYFADVTAGQRLEDMDISVHCDIQIFDWLMRWVKRDSILVADWPLLEPSNVIPILVSASFLQMDPLLQDCLTYCHAHMSEVVKTSTNLACLSDTLITRLAAMYTNTELEAVKDRKDKIQSRLYCKMILSLAEPVPETLRGHYATLATLFKCSKCNKLLGRHIAEQVSCQPASMRVDQRGNVISSHCKDASWSLNEYISWLYSELRSWRRVYWRLWGDCHFLKCQLCDNYFPAYQMEWCSHHDQPAHMFGLEGRPPLPVGRYPCCGERAYRFETLTRTTGCQFREHVPDERLATDGAVVAVFTQFKDIIAMKPPQLVFPERVTRLVAREAGDDNRLQGKEVFWWDGIQLMPPRQPLGLLGKLYTSNTKFNPNARPGSPAIQLGAQGSHMSVSTATGTSPERREAKELLIVRQVVQTATITPEYEGGLKGKKGIVVTGAGAGDDGSEDSGGESGDSSESSGRSSAASEEEPPPKHGQRNVAERTATPKKRGGRVCGRQWVSSQSARSNQDGQRRFEERALRQMRTALARRAPSAHQLRLKTPAGGVYARLEAEWREKYGTPRAVRGLHSGRPRQQQAVKYK